MHQWVKMPIMQFSWNSKAQSFGHDWQPQCQKIVQHKRDLKCHRKSLPSKLALPMNRPFLVWTDETLCPACAVCAQRHPAASCGSLHGPRQDSELKWPEIGEWKPQVQQQLSTTASSCFQGETLNEERLHRKLCIATTIIRSRTRCSGSGTKRSFCCSGSSFGKGYLILTQNQQFEW